MTPQRTTTDKATTPLISSKAKVAELLGPNPILAWLMSRNRLVTPLLVLLLGPGVMWTTHFIYLRNGWLEGVARPLTYFLSATWGDAILLPVLAFLCVWALADIAESGARARLTSWLAWVPAIWALVGTVALHAIWLSDTANMNWTQPLGRSWFGGPLTLNGAGWLHAAFFVLVQWLVAEYTVRLIVTLRSALGDVGLGREQAAAIGRMMWKTNAILVCSLVFSALLVTDYWPQITASQPGQTWTWFLAPVTVLVICLAANGALMTLIARLVRKGRGKVASGMRGPLAATIATWSLVLVPVSAVAVVARFPTVVDTLGLLPGACVALAALAAANVWAEVYLIQARHMRGLLPVAALAAVFGVSLAGFTLSLDMIVSGDIAGSLSALVGPWLSALMLAFVFCAVGAALGVALAAYESLSDESVQRQLARQGVPHLGEESPQHDIVQNLMQFGALQGLLPLFAAGYVLHAEPLMLGRLDSSSQVSLLFGYAGVVVAAVTFPLYNNMQHIRDLESRLRKLRESADYAECETSVHLEADMTFTMALCIAVGVIAVLAAMWMWITVLDLVIATA